MSKREFSSNTRATRTDSGSDGLGSARVSTPDNIIQRSEVLFIDKYLDFYLGHQMQKTAKKQAAYLTQVFRQQEVDAFRAEQAFKMYSDLIADAAKRMNNLCLYRDSCSKSIHPDAATRVDQMVEDALEVLEKLPKAAVGIFLRRYALG